jgi:cell division protein FtsZ
MINADFADVKNIISESGSLLMGMGEASGEKRASLAANQAISSSLLELTISGAKGLVFNITAGSDILLSEIDEASNIITSQVAKDANIIYGQTVDESLKDKIKITVIATGFQKDLLMNRFTRLNSKGPKIDSNDPGLLEIPAYLRLE